MMVGTDIPKLIHENCPSCDPKSYKKSAAKFTGEIEDCGTHTEYVYKCIKCNARLWVDEQWARKHEVMKKQ